MCRLGRDETIYCFDNPSRDWQGIVETMGIGLTGTVLLEGNFFPACSPKEGSYFHLNHLEGIILQLETFELWSLSIFDTIPEMASNTSNDKVTLENFGLCPSLLSGSNGVSRINYRPDVSLKLACY